LYHKNSIVFVVVAKPHLDLKLKTIHPSSSSSHTVASPLPSERADAGESRHARDGPRALSRDEPVGVGVE
jgi:hypothetical protein